MAIRRRGHTLIETTLLLLPMLALVCGSVDLLLGLFARGLVQAAVGEAARLAASPPETYFGLHCADPAPCAARAVEHYSLGLVPASSVRLERHRPGNLIEVRVEPLPWRWIVPVQGLWRGSPMILRASAVSVDGRPPGRISRGAAVKSRRSGISLLEFAIAAPVLVLGLGGVLSIGASLLRTVQAGQVCRAAAAMAAAGVDLRDPASQRLLARAAAGLGLSQADGESPDPNGRAAILAARVTCAPSGEYAIQWQVVIGNQTRWQSSLQGQAARIRQFIELRPGEQVTFVETVVETGSLVPGLPPVVRVRNLS